MSEKARKLLEIQLKEFQSRLDNAEANALKGGKRFIQKLEARIQDLEKELDLEQRHHQDTLKEVYLLYLLYPLSYFLVILFCFYLFYFYFIYLFILLFNFVHSCHTHLHNLPSYIFIILFCFIFNFCLISLLLYSF